MLIYRIESKGGDRYGPFIGTYPAKWNIDYSDSSTNMLSHPTPHMDGIRDFNCTIHFAACKSIEQLRHWFSEHVYKLRKRRMVLRVFEVPEWEILFGCHQVMFARMNYTHVSELPLDILTQ